MKRISLVLAGAIASLLLISAGTAAAMPTEGLVNGECTIHSKNVIGNTVTVVVTGRNVPQSQMKYARCQTVKKVANRLLSLRTQKPETIGGFRCTPTMLVDEPNAKPQVIKYKCVLSGPGGSGAIKLAFQARYNMD